jgi:hypothetical protein
MINRLPRFSLSQILALVAVTRFAQVRATIYRDGANFQLIVERQFADHVSAWLSHAALTNAPPTRTAP